jgi:hypothetical protein
MPTEKELLPVCALISAVSDTVDRYREMSDELVRSLEERGFVFYKAHRRLSNFRATHRSRNKSLRMAYIHYWRGESATLGKAEIYFAMPNDASVLSALSAVLSSMEEDKKNSQGLVVLRWKEERLSNAH